LEKIKKESRKHARIAVYMKVSADGVPNLAGHDFCSYNISEGGIMFVSVPPIQNQTLQVGDKVALSFVINPKAGLFNLNSDIVWVKNEVLTPENKEATCIGAKFINAPESVKHSIASFIKEGLPSNKPKDLKNTCRDCTHFKENVGSKYAFCQLHRITILNSTEDLTMSFNQIYSHPCKDLALKDQ